MNISWKWRSAIRLGQLERYDDLQYQQKTRINKKNNLFSRLWLVYTPVQAVNVLRQNTSLVSFHSCFIFLALGDFDRIRPSCCFFLLRKFGVFNAKVFKIHFYGDSLTLNHKLQIIIISFA
jgi:hypothetical protein